MLCSLLTVNAQTGQRTMLKPTERAAMRPWSVCAPNVMPLWSLNQDVRYAAVADFPVADNQREESREQGFFADYFNACIRCRLP
jgi:hypothetical protein